MGRLTTSWLKLFRSWERPTQIAFMAAFALLVIAFLALAYGPPQVRQPALIGFIGLLFATQIVFMWGSRNMVTPYTQAQRCYLAEDFEGARAFLEPLEASGKANVSALTLLANTYRQLGMVDESETVVRKALSIQIDHFPLYSFGRTLLIKGCYHEAADAFRQALALGAPPIAQLDLGEALYREGLAEESVNCLKAVRELTPESFRLLMADYLLYRLNIAEKPPRELLQAGLPYWRETAQRFRHTLYGQALADDVSEMQALLED